MLLRASNTEHTMAALLKERALERLRKQVRDVDGLPVMSPGALKLACLEHDGYEGPALNDKLFLHFKGYREVCNLEPYVNLKTLFLESITSQHFPPSA